MSPKYLQNAIKEPEPILRSLDWVTLVSDAQGARLPSCSSQSVSSNEILSIWTEVVCFCVFFGVLVVEPPPICEVLQQFSFDAGCYSEVCFKGCSAVEGKYIDGGCLVPF